jgi:hypothetical protein
MFDDLATSFGGLAGGFPMRWQMTMAVCQNKTIVFT